MSRAPSGNRGGDTPREAWHALRQVFFISPKIYLDAHANPGFSGGPVVFAPMGGSPTELRVAGVVANYPASLQPVVDQNRNPITDPEGKPAGLYVQENPGIVVAIGIRHVIQLIEANPIGFPLGD